MLGATRGHPLTFAFSTLPISLSLSQSTLLSLRGRLNLLLRS